MKIRTLYPNETKLLEKAKTNDRVAQELLYNRYAPKMLAVARYYIKDLHFAEDVLMNAFYKAFSRLNQFKNIEGKIELSPIEEELTKNKLIYSNLVFPIHLELGSKRKFYTSYSSNGERRVTHYHNSNSVVVGAGFYGGLNLHDKLRIKGVQFDKKIHSELDLNEIIYGVSGYVSLPGIVAFYGKIDLSPLFKNQLYSQYNVSLGFRFDIN